MSNIKFQSSKMKLRAGDEVLVTAGKDKGRQGKIEKVSPKTSKVLVAGLNVYKKHQKGFGGQKGGIIELSRSLPVASVALICPNCSKPARIGVVVDKLGGKERVCRKCKRIIQTKKE